MVDTTTAQFRTYPGAADTIIGQMQWYLNEVFHFEDWVLTLRFQPVEIGNGSDGEYVGATSAEPRYKLAEIELDLRYLANTSCADRAGIIRHELFHVQVWKLAHLAVDLAKHKTSAQVVIDELEDELVTDLERLKFWRHIDHLSCRR